jgi:hypothetical protein
MSREEGTVSRESRKSSVAMTASDIAGSSVCCGASTFIERPGVCELSSVSDVASFGAVFSCETKVTCRAKKEIAVAEVE